MTDQELLDWLQDLQVRALQAAELMGGTSRGDRVFLDAGDAFLRGASTGLFAGLLITAVALAVALVAFVS